MEDIIAGFLKFQRDSFPAKAELFRELAHYQNPKALFITCSDSRVIPVVICGHSDRGAMTAIASGKSLQEMPAVHGWLRNADAGKAIAATCQHCSISAKAVYRRRKHDFREFHEKPDNESA